MVLDYKNYSKGYRLKHHERRWGRYLLLPLLLGIAYGILYLYAGHQLARGRELADAGQLADAQGRFAGVLKLHTRARAAEDGLGIVELRRGDLAAARDHLLRGGRSAFDPAKVIAGFSDIGLYAQGVQYGEYARGWADSPAVRVEYAVALVGMQRVPEARKLLAALPAGGLPRADAVRKALDALEKNGRFDYLADRANLELASYPAGQPPASPEDSEVAGGLKPDGALSTADLYNHTLLTIDRDMQDAAAASLGYPGAFVVVEPSSGEILAAVSNPPPGDHATNFALEGEFEPGSIIKLITLSAALRTGMDFGQVFPFRCTGSLDCDGEMFYDWAIHKDVNDVNQAIAESCNIAFAKIGLALGREALRDELRRYGFGRAPAGDLPALRFGQLRDAPTGSLATAHLAVGLEDLTITPLQGALIAAAFAGNGTFSQPRLIRERRTILQEPYFQTKPGVLLSTGLPEAARQVIIGAMRKAVETETGTGRRAAVEGLTLALKTGTSGQRQFGLDSVLLGFAPVDSPRIAFCIYARGAGKAELEGARILREFLTRVKSHLQK